MKTNPVFESYLANIKTKSGKTPADFKALAKKKGLLRPGVKAGAIVAWLKKDFDLGRLVVAVIGAGCILGIEPGGDDRETAAHRLLEGMVFVRGVLREELAD